MPSQTCIISRMGRLLCTCECGHRLYLSDSAWGMESVCGKCGLNIKVTRDNTRPLDDDVSPGQTVKKPSVEQCARCGRAFRGDWDKKATNQGVLCHICANQSEELSTTETAAAAAITVPGPAAPDAQKLDVIDHDADQAGEEKPSFTKRFEDFRETRAFRTGLWVAAISVIVLAVLATFIDSAPTPGGMEAQTEIRSAGGLGMFGPPKAWSGSQKAGVRVVMFILEAVFMFAPTFAALFIALVFADRLPGYHWLTSAVHVGFVSLGVGFVLYLVSFVIGTFLGIIGTALAYLVAMFFIWVVYDPGFSTILTFAGLRMVFGFLVGPLRLLAYGALGLLLLD